MLLIAIWGLGWEGEQAALPDLEPFWDKRALRSKEFAVAKSWSMCHVLQRYPVLCADTVLLVLSSCIRKLQKNGSFILKSWIWKCWSRNSGLGHAWREKKKSRWNNFLKCLWLWKITFKDLVSVWDQNTPVRKRLLSRIEDKSLLPLSCLHIQTHREGGGYEGGNS